MTPEALKKKREAVAQQQRNALALYHQASGAIAALDDLIAEMESQDAALEQVKQATGADTAELVQMEKVRNERKNGRGKGEHGQA